MRSLSDPHNDALYRCPSCQNGWTVPPDTPLGSFDDEVKKFMRTLEKMRTINQRLGCQIRFEIQDETKAKSEN
jgi:hypothetical protein